MDRRDVLQSRLAALEQESREIYTELEQLDKGLSGQQESEIHLPNLPEGLPAALPTLESDLTWKWPLQAEDYKRYARQMILPEVGLEGQLRLSTSAVLIVGLGGLGCPAAAYLAGAGVNKLGLIDGDTVEVSNLHRQILHTTDSVGQYKVDSAAAFLKASNPTITYNVYREHLTPQTALPLFGEYDLILDCTDHPTSRYLVSDAAVLTGKQVVSASALRTEGQLVVLNWPPTPEVPTDQDVGPLSHPGGPCYRCFFPRPPPPESLVSCGEGGILGPVVGTMGVLQALEAIKVLTGKSVPEAGSPANMLLFSAWSSPPFRMLRMKGKRHDCVACGERRTITWESLASGSMDYVAFCGVAKPINVLKDDERVAAGAAAQMMEGAQMDVDPSQEPGSPPFIPSHAALIDVREKTHFDLASLPGSINIPFSIFESGQIRSRRVRYDGMGENGEYTESIPDDGRPLLLVCKLGNDSQLAAKRLQNLGYGGDGRFIGDIKGGFKAWRQDVDPTFPDF